LVLLLVLSTALVVAISVAFTASAPLAWRLLILAASVLPQWLFVPVGAQHLWAVLVISRYRRPIRTAFRDRLFLLVVALAGFYTVSLLRGPDPTVGYRMTANLVVLAMVISVALAVADRQRGDLLAVSMGVLVPVVIAQSVSVWLFRLFPGLENGYLRSRVADLLMGGRASRLFSTLPDNVTSSDKAGGLLFYNGNEASMVMAVWALLLIATARGGRARAYRLVALLAASGSLMTGSKTAITLMVIIPAGALLLPRLLSRRSLPTTLLVVLVATPAVGWLVSYGLTSAASFRTASETSATAREDLWDAAGRMFERSPLSGLGFGGWEVAWPAVAQGYDLPRYLPPHNFLIYSWASVGLLGPVLMAAIIFVYMLRSLARVRSAVDVREGTRRSMELAAVAWITAHGMFDTSAFFGSAQTIPLFGLLLSRVIPSRPIAADSFPAHPGVAALPTSPGGRRGVALAPAAPATSGGRL